MKSRLGFSLKVFLTGIFVGCKMNIQARFGILTTTLTSNAFFSRLQKSSSSASSSYLPLALSCSRRKSQDPQQNDDANGEKFSTDWDKAWSNFRKQGKKTFFSQFFPNKYVSWNPRRSNYPLSEEVDPIRRTERSNLMLWTSPGFTLVGAIIIVTFLLMYTILALVK